MKIKTIRKINAEDVYDLEIEDNHNFFANGILVHNCVRGLMKKLGKLDKDPEDVKKWDKVLKKFKNGAEKNGISENEAQNIADDLLKMSGYSFNLSHSTAYTYIAVMTLYLSHYFRKYFYSAVLEYEVDRDKYLVERLVTVKNHGFKILPPDINKSKRTISPGEGNEIIFGLQDIKNVGENAARKIVEEQPFTDFFDYIMRTRSRQVTSATTKNLIKIGAFDKLINKERKKYLQAFTNFWEKKGTSKVREKLELKWKEALNNASNIPFIETKENDFIEYEKEVMGFNFFSSPFTEKRMKALETLHKRGIVYFDFEEVTPISKKLPVSINDMRIIKDKNGNEMAFVEMEDPKGSVQSVPVFSSYWKVIGPKILSAKGKIILVNVFRDNNDKFLFGQKGFVSEQSKILRMVKEMP
jgi:DNA polymerase III subunit alpha